MFGERYSWFLLKPDSPSQLEPLGPSLRSRQAEELRRLAVDRDCVRIRDVGGLGDEIGLDDPIDQVGGCLDGVALPGR